MVLWCKNQATVAGIAFNLKIFFLSLQLEFSDLEPHGRLILSQALFSGAPFWARTQLITGHQDASTASARLAKLGFESPVHVLGDPETPDSNLKVHQEQPIMVKLEDIAGLGLLQAPPK